MTYPTTFGTLPAGNQPASLFDTMFAIVGAMGNISCTATGTNSYSLTPDTNYYQPTAYGAPGGQAFQIVSFVVPNSSTGLVTARLGSLAFLNVYMPSGLQAGSGDLIGGTFVIMAFNAALNLGSGGWQVFNATTPSVIQPVAATFKNLQINNSVGTPDTIISVTADEVMLENVPGGTVKVSSLSLSINTTTSGANGLDTGAMAANTFYSVWVIFNASGPTTAGLISLSATAPVLPSGFTFKARVGWVRTGGASTNLHRVLQVGRRAQYVVTAASQTTSLPVITSSFGAFWTSQATRGATSLVPVTAGIARVQLQANFSGNSGATQQVGVAPNNAYATTSGTSPYPPMGQLLTPSINTIATIINQLGEFVLESNNLFTGVTASAGTVTPVLSAFGWEDNI